MYTGLTWKAETKALSKIKQSADKRLGLTLDAQHGHVGVRFKFFCPTRHFSRRVWCTVLLSSYTGPVKLLTLGIVVQLITDADRKWAKSLESGRPLAGVSHLAL